MADVRFEWDRRKSRANKAKHGVSFEARTAFLDEHARVIPDSEHSDDEERFVLLGLSIQLRVLVVCHCIGPLIGSCESSPLVGRILQNDATTLRTYHEKAIRLFQLQAQSLPR